MTTAIAILPPLGRLLGLCAGALLLFCAERANAQGRLDAQYEATLAGISVGKGSWTIEIGDDTFSASASGRPGKDRSGFLPASTAASFAAASEIGRARGTAIAMNIDGATAVIFCELGFPPPLSRGLFCLSRSVGVLAHGWEQMQQGGRNKGPMPPRYLPEYEPPGDNE